jgi:hypothetical protein
MVAASQLRRRANPDEVQAVVAFPPESDTARLFRSLTRQASVRRKERVRFVVVDHC